MPHYSNGKIYKLVSDVTDKIYIGSTCTSLAKRLGEHKNLYRRFTNGKIAHKSSSSELFKLCGEVKIILIENFPCKSKDELLQRERFHIESSICVNKYIPGRSRAEYNEQNREEILTQMKEYYEANREQILTRNAQYKEANREQISTQKAQYYEANREQILTYKKQYYEGNKDKILASQKAPGLCPFCNEQMRKDSLRRHIKLKHSEAQASEAQPPEAEAEEQVEGSLLIFID